MKENKYSELTKEGCFDAYKNLVSHAEVKWQDAVMLAERGSYGSAISYHIISIEEMTKALVLLIDSMGFDFRKTKGMNKFFQGHQSRYVVMMGIYVISIIGNDILELLKRHKYNLAEIPNHIRRFINGDEEVQVFMENYYYEKAEQLKSILKDFSGLDALRQSGMYVDYVEGIQM